MNELIKLKLNLFCKFVSLAYQKIEQTVEYKVQTDKRVKCTVAYLPVCMVLVLYCTVL